MIDFMKQMAQEAGKEALTYFHGQRSNSIQRKQTAKDLVSSADKAVENKIIGMIRDRFPGHAVFGEETGHHDTSSEYEWIIDPIDGTQSFVKNHPYFSISIALAKNKKVIAGIVYGPALGYLFEAEAGKGARMNGEHIHASACTRLEDAACATGFACVRAGYEKNNLAVCSELVPVIRDIKRCGSAALDLCFTAAGTYDAYWEYGLQLYDIAAGSLIAGEAGACVCDMDGQENYPARGIVAGTKALIPQILPYFKGGFY